MAYKKRLLSIKYKNKELLQLEYMVETITDSSGKEIVVDEDHDNILDKLLEDMELEVLK